MCKKLRLNQMSAEIIPKTYVCTYTRAKNHRMYKKALNQIMQYRKNRATHYYRSEEIDDIINNTRKVMLHALLIYQYS